nr:hypothetical protein [uncultured Sphingomonas sp.]
MESMRIDQQRHGYLGGHQLLSSSIKLPREDQDVVDRLSDIGGQPGPNETVPDYLTGYPLPSRSHFAFARTWYDSTAPRAGCVLTHTLLVPIADWSATKSLLALAHLHTPFDRERAGRRLPALELVQHAYEPYPFCPTKGLAELCEAVFLEERQPIVWFTEPNDMSVLRLVEALWPALRAKFAFQSYALKPRSKADGPFDMMAAPRSARSRFSVWEGRRVEGSAEARHQFTPLLVQSIFESPHPSLDSADPLGVLELDEVGDASKLRLSILWNSLRSSGESDPTAALGMLDVLSAAALPAGERWKRAEPLFRRAFEVACSREGRAGNLMGLALGKLEDGDGRRLSDSLSRTVACLSRTEPESGIRLAAANWRDQSATPIVRQTVAEALAAVPVDRLWNSLQAAPEPVAVDLLDREPKLLVELAGLQSDEPRDWDLLASFFDRLDEKTVERIRMPVLGKIHSDKQVPIVRYLLADLSAPDLVSAVRRLDKSGALKTPSFAKAFAELTGPSRQDKLAALAEAHLPASHSRVAFDALLKPTARDFEWLLKSRLQQGLKSDLLGSLVVASTQTELRRAGLSESQRLAAVLEALPASNVGADAAARLLAGADGLNDEVISHSVARFGRDSHSNSRHVIATLIAKLVPLENGQDANRLAALLATSTGSSAVEMVAPSIVDLLAPEYVRHEERTYALGLMVAEHLSDDLRERFISELPTFSARASSYRVSGLVPAAYDAWAKLVDEAVAWKSSIGQRAAESALAYVLKRESEASLPLVLASFPTVFNEALSAPGRRGRDPQDLARTICRMFVRHGWNGEAFLQLIVQTNDHGMMLEAVLRPYDGENYLRKSFAKFGVQLSKSDIRANDVSTWHVGFDGLPHDATGLLVASPAGDYSKGRRH